MTRTTVDGSGRTGIIGGRGGGRGQYRLRMFRSSEVSHGRCSIGGGHLVACCVSICGIDEPPASPIHTRPLNTTSCTLCNIRTYPNSLCNIGVPYGAPLGLGRAGLHCSVPQDSIHRPSGNIITSISPACPGYTVHSA